MTFPDVIALATRNTHKLREIERICAEWPVDWVTVHTHPDVDWPDVPETAETYTGNASLKARAVAGALDLPAISDDSGIEVDALGGAPGPMSARYSGPGATDETNLRAMIAAIAGIPREGRTARYRCVVVMASPTGGQRQTEGTCEGTLIARPSGARGFGYDPIFVPAGWDRTMAELTDEQKDRISHRGRALRAMRDLLTES